MATNVPIPDCLCDLQPQLAQCVGFVTPHPPGICVVVPPHPPEVVQVPTMTPLGYGGLMVIIAVVALILIAQRRFT